MATANRFVARPYPLESAVRRPEQQVRANIILFWDDPISGSACVGDDIPARGILKTVHSANQAAMIQILLDFGGHQSVAVSANLKQPTGTDSIDRTITALLTEIHSRLAEATRIAKAAEACAKTGSVTKGIQIPMDIEQPIYEATRLRDAAALLRRMRRGQT